MDKILEMIENAAVAFAKFWTEGMPARIWNFGDVLEEWWNSKLEDADDVIAQYHIDRMEADGTLPPALREEMEKARDMPYPWGLLNTTISVALLGVFGLKSWLSGAGNLRGQIVNAQLKPNLMPMEALSTLAIKYPQLQAQIDVLYDKWGIPEDQRALMQLAVQALPNLNEILSLVNREEITYNDGVEMLARQGFSGDNATRLLELRKWLPSPQDVVMLAGREAFEEDQIREFNLDGDMPGAMFEWGRKVGLDDETLRLFWVAHWQNPSLNQVFEMIHREVEKPGGGTFTVADLPVFYRLADVQPYFGAMLEQIAYQPLTRVDVRRMFNMGVLEFKDVEKAYRHLGYSPENATLMARFAAAEKERTGKNLTRSQLEKLYKLGLLTEAELFDQLVAIGYDDLEAHQLIDLLDADIDEDRFHKIIKRVEWEYKRDLMDVNVARSRLANLEMLGIHIDTLIDEWDAERVIEQRLPSKEDVLGWYSSGAISPAQARIFLQQLQYREEVIELYLQSTGTRPSKTDLLAQFDRDVIDEARAREGLAALGYDQRDVDAFVRVVELQKVRRAEFEAAQAARG